MSNWFAKATLAPGAYMVITKFSSERKVFAAVVLTASIIALLLRSANMLFFFFLVLKLNCKNFKT